MLIEENIHNIILFICSYILYIINLIDNDYLRNLYFTYIDYFEINQTRSFFVIYIEKSIWVIICLYIVVKCITYKL
jgi:hypothetical protein